MSMHASQSCCGFGEFAGLRGKTPKDILGEVLSAEGLASHVLFTDITASAEMPKLVSIINALGLGEIVQGPVAVNPSSRNRITGWIFAPNYGKVRTFVNSAL